MWGGVYIMKGTINMEFAGRRTKIAVNVKSVGTSDKCSAVDSLLDALEAKGDERLMILAMVMDRSLQENDGEEEEADKNESRCFRN